MKEEITDYIFRKKGLNEWFNQLIIDSKTKGEIICPFINIKEKKEIDISSVILSMTNGRKKG